MLRSVLLFSLILCPLVICKRRQHNDKDSSDSAGDLGGKLVSDLRDDANIDLSADEEYEDLRAELLAYHTALASLTSSRTNTAISKHDDTLAVGMIDGIISIRKREKPAKPSDEKRGLFKGSIKTTPCWQLGGICIDHKMCEGHRSLSEVAGCRDRLEVCCFNWNNYQVRDMTDKGIPLPMPWSQSRDFGGEGVLDPPSSDENLKKKKKLSKVIMIDEGEDMYTKEEKEQRDKSQENPPLLVVLRHKKKT